MVEESLRTDIMTSLSRWEFLNAYFGFAYRIKESRTTHPFAMAGQLFKGYFLISRNFKRSKRNSDYRIVASCFSPVQIDHWNTFSFNLCHKSSNNRSVGIWQDKVCVLAKLKPKLIVVFAVSLVRRDCLPVLTNQHLSSISFSDAPRRRRHTHSHNNSPMRFNSLLQMVSWDTDIQGHTASVWRLPGLGNEKCSLRWTQRFQEHRGSCLQYFTVLRAFHHSGVCAE